MSDIVERLEYTAKHGLTKAADAHRYASHAEARDEIVRLRAEVGELQQRSVEWREAYEDAEEERDRLRAALFWYADQMCEYSTEYEGCGKLTDYDCAGCKARAALGDKP
jgi:hypothetical protein